MFQSPVFIMIFRFCAKMETQPLSRMWPVGGTILDNKGTDQARRTANLQSHSTMQMPQQPYEDTMNYSPFELFCFFPNSLNFITATSSSRTKFFPSVKCKDKLAKWVNSILVSDISLFTHYSIPKSI